MTTDVHEGIDGVMFAKKVGDVLVRLSVEQVRVLAVEIEVLLRAKHVALEYVHRSLNVILD